jgi:O-antigen/teichoic acid export membrane protein
MSLVFFWISSFFQAALFWLVSIYISKQFGVQSLGEFSYALAIVSPLVILSGLQLRNYCLTQKDIGLFAKAKSIRLVFSLISIIALALWSSIFSPFGVSIIALVALIKFSELWSDLCFGFFQNKSRLGTVALFQSLKYGSLISVMLAGMYFSVEMSFWTFLLLFSIFLFLTAIIDYVYSGLSKLGWDWAWDKQMLKTTFYLSLASFLTTFSINIPRYFLEHYLSLSEVALFSGLFYFYLIPHLGFNYLNIAFLKKMSDKLTGKAFVGICLLLVLLSSVCFFVLDFYGTQLLKLLYNLDVEWTRVHSVLLSYLVFISGMLSFLYYYLLSAQIYEIQIKANLGALLVTFFFSWYLVPEMGVVGGLYSLSLANSFLAIIYLWRFFSHKNIKI